MCLMCQEEDLYFLYLERLEQERRRAEGEKAPANPNWLWPSLAQAQPVDPDPAYVARPPRAAAAPTFICDAPGE
jgi:hypothetical protein